MTCKNCGRKVSKEEEKTMKEYGFENCVECRKKKERPTLKGEQMFLEV